MSVAATTTPTSGWYPDPQDGTRLRWWDGHGWTAHTIARPADEAQQNPQPADEPQPFQADSFEAHSVEADSQAEVVVEEPEAAVEEPEPTEASGEASDFVADIAAEAPDEPIQFHWDDTLETDAIRTSDFTADVSVEPLTYAGAGGGSASGEPEAATHGDDKPKTESGIRRWLARGKQPESREPESPESESPESESPESESPESDVEPQAVATETQEADEVESMSAIRSMRWWSLSRVPERHPAESDEPEQAAESAPLDEVEVEQEPVAEVADLEPVAEAHPEPETAPQDSVVTSGWGYRPAEPVVEVEPEPAAEVEPVVEVEPEPAAEVEVDSPSMIRMSPFAAVTDPDPVVEVEPEPVVEIEPEPAAEAPAPAPVYEPEPITEDMNLALVAMAESLSLGQIVAPERVLPEPEPEPVAAVPEPEPELVPTPASFVFRARPLTAAASPEPVAPEVVTVPVYESPLDVIKSPLPVGAPVMAAVELPASPMAPVEAEPVVEPAAETEAPTEAAVEAPETETEPEAQPTAEAEALPAVPGSKLPVPRRALVGSAGVVVAAAAAAGISNLISDDPQPAAPAGAAISAADRECLKEWNTTVGGSAAQLRVTLGQFSGALAKVQRVAPLPGTLMAADSCALTVYDPGTETNAIFVSGVKDQVGYIDVTSYPRAKRYGWPQSEKEANVTIREDGTISAL